MRNIIDAIISLTEITNFSVAAYKSSNDKVKGRGASFEDFARNLFAGSLESDKDERARKLVREFSYLGGDKNPPDAMIRGGDVIEFKKVGNKNTPWLQLNSSSPAQTLQSNSPHIEKKCKNAEKWKRKDIIYTVGALDKGEVRRLWMVYGSDYCDSNRSYLKLLKSLKNALRHEIKGKSQYGYDSDSKEPLRVKSGIDHLNVATLRMRAMWSIQSPWRVFSDQYEAALKKHKSVAHSTGTFEFVAIINDKKWKALGNAKKLLSKSMKKKGVMVYDVEVRKPDTRDEMTHAKMVIYTK